MFEYIICILIGMLLGSLVLLLMVKYLPSKWFIDILDEDE